MKGASLLRTCTRRFVATFHGTCSSAQKHDLTLAQTNARFAIFLQYGLCSPTRAGRSAPGHSRPSAPAASTEGLPLDRRKRTPRL